MFRMSDGGHSTVYWVVNEETLVGLSCLTGVSVGTLLDYNKNNHELTSLRKSGIDDDTFAMTELPSKTLIVVWMTSAGEDPRQPPLIDGRWTRTILISPSPNTADDNDTSAADATDDSVGTAESDGNCLDDESDVNCLEDESVEDESHSRAPITPGPVSTTPTSTVVTPTSTVIDQDNDGSNISSTPISPTSLPTPTSTPAPTPSTPAPTSTSASVSPSSAVITERETPPPSPSPPHDYPDSLFQNGDRVTSRYRGSDGDQFSQARYPGVILHTCRSGRGRRMIWTFDVLFDDGYVEKIELVMKQTGVVNIVAESPSAL